jgi:hypothetical protein
MPPPMTEPQAATIASAPAHLLCEQCGYPLTRTGPADVCSECGRAAALSLPERRAGSAWQQRPGLRPWAATLWRTLRKPRDSWHVVRVETRRATWLLMTNLLVAGMASGSAILGMPISTAPPLISAVSVGIVAALSMAALTSVEFFGVMFFGSRRGWRITPRSALVIVSHASVGWLVSGFGLLATAQTMYRLAPGLIDARPLGSTGVPGVAWFLMILAVPLLGGMVLFSSLAGLGFHAMRFANPPHKAA